MKKVIGLLISVCMILSSVPVTVSAAQAAGSTFTAGDFTYKVNTDTSTVTLTSIAASALSGAVTVPGSVSDGTSTYTVTQLGDAFKNVEAKTKEMTSLVLPDSITKFTGTAQFYACKGLDSIHLPANLTGDATGTGYLTKSFYYCSKLTAVELPAGITKCYGTFNSNSGVRTVTITSKSAVDFFGGSGTKDARAWADGITGIKIYYPADGAAPTRYTGSFTATIIKQGDTPTPQVTGFEIDDFEYSIISDTDTVNVKGFSSTSDKTGEKVLPQTVTYGDKTYTVVQVGYAAFANNTKLTSFIMPDTVTSMGTNAFYGCTKLQYVHLSENLANVSASRQLVGAFQYCTSLKSVIIPAGITCLPKTFLYSGVEDIVLKAKSTELPKGSSNEYVPVSNPNTVRIYYPSDGGVVGGYKSYISNYFVYDGSIAYKVKEDNSFCAVSILPGYSLAGDVTLPAAVGALGVTEIAPQAFKDADDITAVTVPDSVVTIGEEAFADCDNLTSVTLPESIRGGLNRTFAGCTKLSTVIIPAGIETLSGTFEGASRLTDVKFPPTVTTISDKAFYGCNSLLELAIPDTVTSITDGDNPLGTVFPDNCTLIVKRDSAAHTYAVENNINYVIKSEVEYAVKSGSAEITGTNFRIVGEYEIPHTVTIGGNSYTVTSIAANAFKNQDALTVLSVPDSLSHIDSTAFSGCTNEAFAVRADSQGAAYPAVKAVGVSYIADDTDTGLAYKKYASKPGLEIYGSANGAELSGDIAILAYDGEDIVSIGEGAFEGQSNITGVTMPDTVTSIKKSAFADCQSLETADLSDNTEGVLDSVFEGCIKLEAAKIPSGVTALKNTYNGCASLTRVTVPESVTAIYANTFADCTGLETVIIPETVTAFDRIVAFKDETQEEAEYVETNTSKKWVDNPFKGAVNQNLAICGQRGSAAEEFAYSSGIRFVDIAKGNYPLDYRITDKNTVDITVRDVYQNGDVTIIGALYDNSGKLIDCKTVTADFDSDGCKSVFNGEFLFEDYAEDTTLKLMVWNDLETLIPIKGAQNVEEPEKIKILILGNSISNHGTSESVGWFAPDKQGMAATSLDKDFAHIVLQKAQEINPNAEINIVTAWSLEAGFERWQSLIESEYQDAVNYDADIIIAQFGENVKNNANEGSLGGNFDNENEFSAATFANIVKAFIKDGKDVPVIVVTSMMSNNATVLNAKQQAATDNGWAYVNLCNDSNFSESKNSAYYLTPNQIELGLASGTFRDGVTIGSGVYVHPGNNGMRAIAYGIWRYAEPVIEAMSYGK